MILLSRDGDYYAALKDCCSALCLDADHLKANFRMAKCLYELSWTTEGFDCLQLFMTKFPDYATSTSCQQLNKDIRTAIYSNNTDGKTYKQQSVPMIELVRLNAVYLPGSCYIC